MQWFGEVRYLHGWVLCSGWGLRGVWEGVSAVQCYVVRAVRSGVPGLGSRVQAVQCSVPDMHGGSVHQLQAGTVLRGRLLSRVLCCLHLLCGRDAVLAVQSRVLSRSVLPHHNLPTMSCGLHPMPLQQPAGRLFPMRRKLYADARLLPRLLSLSCLGRPLHHHHRCWGLYSRLLPHPTLQVGQSGARIHRNEPHQLIPALLLFLYSSALIRMIPHYFISSQLNSILILVLPHFHYRSILLSSLFIILGYDSVTQYITMQQVRKKKINISSLFKQNPKGSMVEINSRLQKLTTSEHSLLHQIEALNSALTHVQRKIYKSGYFFDHVLCQQLCTSLAQFLTKNVVVSQCGFDLCTLDYRCNKTKADLPLLNPQSKTIQRHIDQSYFNKIKDYRKGAHCYARKHLKPQWSLSFKSNNKTESSSPGCCHKTNIINIDKKMGLKTEAAEISQKMQMQHSFREAERKKVVLKQLLKGCKVGSVWLPPSSCPQLVGCFTYSVTRGFALRMHRYCFLRHALNANLFDAMLEWAEQFIGMPLSCIELMTSKQAFASKWSKIGWNLAAWQTQDTYIIRYLRRF